MNAIEQVYTIAMAVLGPEQHVELCAKLLGIDLDILRAWLARRREGQR